LFTDFVPSFVKQYAHLGETIAAATADYIEEVRGGRFPATAGNKS
jgi:3-methyl-2-oxobutanoate hydroxymethyltransferase